MLGTPGIVVPVALHARDALRRDRAGSRQHRAYARIRRIFKPSRGMMEMNSLVLVNRYPREDAARASGRTSARDSGTAPVQVRSPRAGRRGAGGEVGSRRRNALFVIGGDGTLHEAVNGLARAGRLEAVRVAVIPAGTGNDFARSTGMRTGGLPSLDGGASGGPRAVALRDAGRPHPNPRVSQLRLDRHDVRGTRSHDSVGGSRCRVLRPQASARCCSGRTRRR
jgi:hypothetical protein